LTKLESKYAFDGRTHEAATNRTAVDHFFILKYWGPMARARLGRPIGTVGKNRKNKHEEMAFFCQMIDSCFRTDIQ
jgi:hypothetical protein